MAKRPVKNALSADVPPDIETGMAPPEEAPASASPARKAEAREVLQVTGPRRPYRRAGFAFGPEPVTLDPRDLTDDQVGSLTSDPYLTVRGVDVADG